MRSEDDIRKERLNAMGEVAGHYYHHLWRELNLIHYKWKELRAFMGQGPEITNLVNATAPWFFHIASSALWKDVVVTIGAFSDPAFTRKQRNASLHGLLDVLKEEGRVTQEMGDALEQFKATCKPIRELRNKWLAHWDHELMLNVTDRELTLHMDQVEASFEAMALVMNLVEQAYFGSVEIIYNLPLPPRGSCEELLYYLELGHKTAKEERQRNLRKYPHQ